MRLIIVRHGQTNANANRLIQGRIDNPLNKIGIKQAKKTGQILKKENISFDIIASSPLSRALETANLIARKTNYKDNIYINHNFVERDFRPFEMEKVVDIFPIIINTNFTHPEYEDDKTLEDRINKGIYQLYNKYKNNSVLLSAHAHVIRATYILANPSKYDYDNHYLGNASVHVFEVNEKEITYLYSKNNKES